MARFFQLFMVVIFSAQAGLVHASGRDPVMPSINNSDEFEVPRRPKIPSIRLQRDTRGMRVAMTSDVAEVPEEFACPLFEHKAYEGILESLNKLNDAVKSFEKCPNAPNPNVMAENTGKIKEAVNILKPFFENPENAHGNMPQIEQAISQAVLGVDAVTQAVVNPNFTNTPCGQNAYHNGGIASTVSNLINSLGPYALLGISLAPGLSLAIKGGALALIAGSTAYNEYQKIVDSHSLDLKNHEHWRSVVQNTCAYSRVARKLNYIQRFESGLIPAVEDSPQILPVEVQKKVIAFNQKYSQPQDSLGNAIMVSTQERTQFELMSKSLHQSRLDLSRLYSQVGDIAKGNADLICSVGLEVAEQSQNKTEFPSTLMSSIHMLTDFNVDPRSYSSLNKTYQRLIGYFKGLDEKDLLIDSTLDDCADKTKSLLDILSRTIVAYEKALKDVETARETVREKNPEYKKWKDELKTIQAEQRMGKQLFTVVKGISDSPAILKSYLNQRQTALKRSLFGPTGWISSQSPVYKWLDETLSLHKGKIKDFKTNLGHLTSDVFYLKARELDKTGKPTFADDKKLREAFVTSFSLDYLDIKNFNLSDPASMIEHQNVCQRLLHTWDDWDQAVNHLDSVGHFCDMINPLLDSTVDKNTIVFCRGTDQDIKYPYVTNSKVAEALSVLGESYGRPMRDGTKRSLQDMAMAIPQLLKSMKCKVPGNL